MNEPFGQFVLQLGKLKDKISDEEYFESVKLTNFSGEPLLKGFRLNLREIWD